MEKRSCPNATARKVSVEQRNYKKEGLSNDLGKNGFLFLQGRDVD